MDGGGVISKSQRDKGARKERELVNLHRDLGFKAERVPLSGATNYRANPGDVDCYVFGKDQAPLIFECKARGNGEGFKTLEKWLEDGDALALMRDRQKPLIVLRWSTYLRMIRKEDQIEPSERTPAGTTEATGNGNTTGTAARPTARASDGQRRQRAPNRPAKRRSVPNPDRDSAVGSIGPEHGAIPDGQSGDGSR